MWGAVYTFTKAALDEVSPAFITAARLFFAAVVLLPAAPILSRVFGEVAAFGWGEAARLWRAFLVLGVLNAVVPYAAIAWGTQYMPSGVAAILNSTQPIFTAVLCAALPSFADERLRPSGLLGLLSGLAGVVVLVGGGGFRGSGDTPSLLLGAAAVLLGALSFALAGLYARSSMRGVPVPVTAVGQSAVALPFAVPLVLLGLPAEPPSAGTILSLMLLGAVGTGLALLLFFRLIRTVGATRTSTVAYLVPVAALLYGVLLLGEPLTARAVVGLALILAGVAGVSGIFRSAHHPRQASPGR
jgi:drug/metabolite transporter (DMT)-like permease